MIYILDASALINGFYSKDSRNLMTSTTVSEIKDLNTEILLNNLIDEEILEIVDVNYEDDFSLHETLLDSGDYMRLSATDKDIVFLATKLSNEYEEVVVVTDDYSMQNTLKLMNIRYKSVLTKGIDETVSWKKICKGCKKEYPSDYEYDDCEICGSQIITKRTKIDGNY